MFRYCRHVRPRCLVSILFFLNLICDFVDGSPVEAFSTSPPSSLAISARRRLLTADLGRSAVTSFVEAKRSRCLISSQDLSALPPKPRVRTSTHEPRSFAPLRVNLRSPLFSAPSTSLLSAVQVPLSHTITVPPPYPPSGITPSNAA